MTKPCRQCGVLFTPTPRQQRKFDFICVECRNAYNRDWYKARIEAGIKRVPKNPWTKEQKAEWALTYYSKADVRARRAAWARAARANPEHAHKNAARWAVKRALEAGQIFREPCFICGSVHSEAHHPHYGEPLMVSWLCRAHHAQLHMDAKAESEGD